MSRDCEEKYFDEEEPAAGLPLSAAPEPIFPKISGTPSSKKEEGSPFEKMVSPPVEDGHVSPPKSKGVFTPSFQSVEDNKSPKKLPTNAVQESNKDPSFDESELGEEKFGFCPLNIQPCVDRRVLNDPSFQNTFNELNDVPNVENLSIK